MSNGENLNVTYIYIYIHLLYHSLLTILGYLFLLDLSLFIVDRF